MDFNELLTNPMFNMGVGMLANNRGRDSRAAFGNSLSGGLQSMQQASLFDMQRKKYQAEIDKQKQAQLKYENMKRAAQMQAQSLGLDPAMFTTPAGVRDYHKSLQGPAAQQRAQFFASEEGRNVYNKLVKAYGAEQAGKMIGGGGVNVSVGDSNVGSLNQSLEYDDWSDWVNGEGKTWGEYVQKNGLTSSTVPQALKAGFYPLSTKGAQDRGDTASQAQAFGSLYELQRDIYNEYEGQGWGERWLTGAGGNFLGTVGADSKLGNDIKLWDDKSSAMLTGLARMVGQVGTLTEGDVEVVTGMLPQPYPTTTSPFPDNPEVAKRKMADIERYLRSKGINVNWQETNPDSMFTGEKNSTNTSEEEFVLDPEVEAALRAREAARNAQ